MLSLRSGGPRDPGTQLPKGDNIRPDDHVEQQLACPQSYNGHNLVKLYVNLLKLDLLL